MLPGEMQPGVKGLEQSHLLLPRKVHAPRSAGVAHTAAMARKPKHHTREYASRDGLPVPTAF